MKKMCCEMCGSNDIVKNEGVYVCGSCGTKYTVEEAKKLIIEGTVNVNLENSKEVSSDVADEIQNKKSERLLILGCVFVIISVAIFAVIAVLSSCDKIPIDNYSLGNITVIPARLSIIIPSILIVGLSVFSIIRPRKFNLIVGIIYILIFAFLTYNIFISVILGERNGSCFWLTLAVMAMALGIVGAFMTFVSSLFNLHGKKK